MFTSLTSDRMADLVASAAAPGKPSSTSSSVQLKPMSDGPRYAVCSLARYYRLNAFEYDNEPKRYVMCISLPFSYYIFNS